jgi:RNA polymerase sigma-70 factor, ECF subfamily
MQATCTALYPGGEDDLAARCRAGDLDAFAQVYAQYQLPVFRYAYHLMGNRDDADDIKQETFLKAYQAIGNFRSASNLQTWLLKICFNLCRDRMRSWDRRHVVYDSTLREEAFLTGSDILDPAAIAERTEMTETVFHSLREMPKAQREILILHGVEDRSYDEIAGILGCTRAGVKLRLFRARRALKERVALLLKTRAETTPP